MHTVALLVEYPSCSTLVFAARVVTCAELWAGIVIWLDLPTLTYYNSMMAKRDKILDTLLRGRSDANIAFTDLCGLLKRLGFAERVRGDHHIFARDDVEEILNLQPKQAKAKPYQVKQVRAVIHRYRLAGDDDDDQ